MNRSIKLFSLLFVFIAVLSASAFADAPLKAKVVILHGLARTPASMSSMAKALEAAGYEVCNVAYPSRQHSVAVLAVNFVAPKIVECVSDPQQAIHFVTHSLGGIVVRQLAAAGLIANFGRVVMLSPPNQGTEIVDKLGKLRLFEVINGPAGSELGTGANELPMRLGPASFELGVITGTRSINMFLSLMIPGADDGKVSVNRAKLEGMKDFVTVPTAHPFIMKSSAAIEQTMHFLKRGEFMHQPSQTNSVLFSTRGKS